MQRRRCQISGRQQPLQRGIHAGSLLNKVMRKFRHVKNRKTTKAPGTTPANRPPFWRGIAPEEMEKSGLSCRVSPSPAEAGLRLLSAAGDQILTARRELGFKIPTSFTNGPRLSQRNARFSWPGLPGVAWSCFSTASLSSPRPNARGNYPKWTAAAFKSRLTSHNNFRTNY